VRRVRRGETVTPGPSDARLGDFSPIIGELKIGMATRNRCSATGKIIGRFDDLGANKKVKLGEMKDSCGEIKRFNGLNEIRRNARSKKAKSYSLKIWQH
jgi:hypothetical protein